MKIAGVYVIKNIANSKCYVGSSIDCRSRRKDHLFRLRKGSHHNKEMQKEFRQFGENAYQFSVLEKVENEEKLIELEQYYIDLMQPEYNIRIRADSNSGIVLGPHSKEWREKISLGQKGKTLSEETKSKISRAKIGKKLTMQHRQHIGISCKGNEPWNKGKTGIYSNETRLRIAQANQGEKNIFAKLTEQQVRSIKGLLKCGYSMKSLAGIYQVNEMTIYRIKSGKTWSHINI